MKPKPYVRTKVKAPRISAGALSQLLGVSVPAIKTAMKQGDEYFAQYCLERCGVAYRAINVAKLGAKIPRWKFEEIEAV